MNARASGDGPRLLALTALAPALFGTTYLVATSELLPPDRPLLLACLRVLPAAGALLLIARPRLPRALLLRCALIGSFSMGLFFAAFFLAAQRLPNGVAATVSNTTPLFVLACTPIILREHPPTHRLVAGAAGVVGVALLVGASPAGLSTSGLIGGFGSAALLALGLLCTRRWLAEVPALDAAAVQLSSGGLVLLILWALFDGHGAPVDGGLVVGTAVLSLALTAVPYVLLFGGIRRLGADRVALLSPLTPVVATALGVAFRHERLTSAQALGLLVVLTSMVIAQRPGRRGDRTDGPPGGRHRVQARRSACTNCATDGLHPSQNGPCRRAPPARRMTP